MSMTSRIYDSARQRDGEELKWAVTYHSTAADVLTIWDEVWAEMRPAPNVEGGIEEE